jgi:hypothetical protein
MIDETISSDQPVAVDELVKPNEIEGLKEQAKVYADFFRVDQKLIENRAKELLASMSDEDKRGLTMLVYVPEGTTVAGLVNLYRKSDQVNIEDKIVGTNFNVDKIRVNGETNKATVAFARDSLKPDSDTIENNARSAEDWAKSNGQYMTLKLGLAARLINPKMDQDYATSYPEARIGSGDDQSVIFTYFNPGSGRVNLHSGSLKGVFSSRGVRKIVSREY